MLLTGTSDEGDFQFEFGVDHVLSKLQKLELDVAVPDPPSSTPDPSSSTSDPLSSTPDPSACQVGKGDLL